MTSCSKLISFHFSVKRGKCVLILIKISKDKYKYLVNDNILLNEEITESELEKNSDFK